MEARVTVTTDDGVVYEGSAVLSVGGGSKKKEHQAPSSGAEKKSP